MRVRLFLIAFIITLCVFSIDGRKVRNSFKIEKEDAKSSETIRKAIDGKEIKMNDLILEKDSIITNIRNDLNKCRFAGYEKEPNSNIESFIFINESKYPIKGFEIQIDYLDMQGRMLHSRKVLEPCSIPSGETRKFDLKSWDKQHTYYYYLGNEPRRVATPFQVTFTPLSFFIEE